MTSLILEVYDADEDKMVGNEPKLVPDNYVGKVVIQMSDVVRNMGIKTKHDIIHDKHSGRGFLKLYAEQSSANKDYVRFEFDFHNLKKNNSNFFTNLFSSSFQPVLRIGKQIEDGS